MQIQLPAHGYTERGLGDGAGGGPQEVGKRGQDAAKVRKETVKPVMNLRAGLGPIRHHRQSQRLGDGDDGQSAAGAPALSF